ncbi:glutathionylspermidine synthase family protein [Motilibacter deserti]|uniref:Glutathionylspermidine synthase family protein n=1 Tax=Motilibacter deserti TaxID=2714956 RepID=A0ABX0GVW1_9ACTN|nr:glutathionylspermidine synthase family protein [Motilibacter deserti]
MWRHSSPPRKDWRRKVEAQGLVYPTTKHPDGSETAYWNESAFYELSEAEVEHLEEATEELHRMSVEAARFLASGELGDLGLVPGALELARASLERGDVSVYGRFDLRYDGTEPAKLLEYNADTPTGLLEASVAQWYWLEDVMPSTDQWNSLHERLVQAWRSARPKLRSPVVHFAHHPDDETNEEWMTVAYMRDVATEAGLETVGLTVTDIGWDHDRRRFVDLDDAPIDTAFVLYPWEDMLRDEFGRRILEDPLGTTWVEPAWKVLASNKALLAALWHCFPDSEYLLPAYLDEPGSLTDWVAKPLHGREGDGIRIRTADVSHDQGSERYGAEGFVYQQYAALPAFDGNYAVIGSWVVDGKAAGAGIRESDGLVTDSRARFVPHVLSAPRPDEATSAAWLREA